MYIPSPCVWIIYFTFNPGIGGKISMDSFQTNFIFSWITSNISDEENTKCPNRIQYRAGRLNHLYFYEKIKNISDTSSHNSLIHSVNWCGDRKNIGVVTSEIKIQIHNNININIRYKGEVEKKFDILEFRGLPSLISVCVSEPGRRDQSGHGRPGGRGAGGAGRGGESPLRLSSSASLRHQGKSGSTSALPW